MRLRTLWTTAWQNTRGGGIRSILTVLAVVVGAFTLTLTTGVGAGVHGHIDRAVAELGDPDELHVRLADDGSQAARGPTTYRGADAAPRTESGQLLLREQNLDTIAGIPGIVGVRPVIQVDPEYVQGPDGQRWDLDLDLLSTLEDDRSTIAIPPDWVPLLGGVGFELSVGVLTLDGQEVVVPVDVTEVLDAQAPPGALPVPSRGFVEALEDARYQGAADVPRTYATADAWVADVADIPAVVAALEEAGFLATTIEDELGLIGTIVNGIVGTLSGFAAIALIAAGLGIVNALVMSTHERTREIGLMRALGLGTGRVFTVFCLEAVIIGGLGALLGIGAGIGVGLASATLIAGAALRSLPASALFAVDPTVVGSIFLAVVTLAFLAGVSPALRAARRPPITALRHE
ncbi:hypothetical protein BJF80_05870 [Serinicoccus sp. CUA-874]|uniref:ABC transporter permease n=1 Tax=Serinicoccus sp. CUA-874 TaxID=1517939 RepID=UPI00096835E0|nr:ABC transporter permease [Serinicoccus sp. CUA-874]OLT16826.1 hypothetical protein BJF80_05870 [Serinicoccus sp. CUA-874]